MLINKKKIKIIKLFLLSSILHQLILVFYLVTLPIIMATYTAKRFFNPSGINEYIAIRELYFPKSYWNTVDLKGIYEYLYTIHSLYFPEGFAQFLPVSAIRISQNR